jgi:DNA polymerase-3 subunit delta
MAGECRAANPDPDRATQMDSLTFLDRASKAKPQPVYVLHGEEHFLKRQVVAALRKIVLGGEDDSFGLSTFAGDKATFAAVRNELSTLPFLAPRRLVVVEGADPFVQQERPKLEKYVAEPAATGVLVLEVKSWPSNTKLAKLVPENTTIQCKPPPTHDLPQWCAGWCAARYAKQLAGPAARLLVDLVGVEMGQLDQELNKLATYVGEASRIEAADVDQLVGDSRAEKTFEIFVLIGNGETGKALTMLDRLLDQGEDPLKLLGAFSWQLRRLVQASRLQQQKIPPAEALEKAGVPPFARRSAEQQLRHYGPRVNRLYDWLLQTDQQLKGGSHLPPRTVLEQFVIKLARTAPR